MERRQEPRLKIDRRVTVKVTVLGSEGLELPGELVNLSGKGAALLLDRALPLDAAVRIDIDDAVLLGEVRWCRGEGAVFTVGLSVEHWLPNLKELARMMYEIRRP